MKLECSLDKIKNAISQTERITGKNLTLPVLNSILFIASENTLRLRAMNLNLGIEVKIPAKIETEGILAVSGGVLNNVFSNINQNENILLEGIDGNLFIKSKKSEIKIKGQQSDDFPTIPIVEGDTFEINSKKFIEGIKSVYYSASVSDIKPEISSVYIYSNEDQVFFVSTDSFRLAEKIVKLKKVLDIYNVIIPYKNIIEILRIFGEIDGDISICLNKNQISFSYENIYLTSRVIDGSFPDYKQIIPKEAKTEAIILKQDLINALKITNIFADKFNQIDLSIDVKNKKLELKSTNNDIGENKTNIDASLKGENVSVSFNYKYLNDCLSSINTDSVVLKLNDSNKPIIVSALGDNSFTYLVMPMNR